jgi:hypothetical protein
MKKSFTFWQLFSVVDGRLSTGIEDVYEILNHVCDDELFTHHLPVAHNYLRIKSPQWFQEALVKLSHIREAIGTNDFLELRKHIEFDEGKAIIEVPQLKDEMDTSDYGKFMVDNSLLFKMFSK